MKTKVGRIVLIVVLCSCLLLAAGFSVMASDITWSSDYLLGNRITIYLKDSSYSNPYIYCYASGYEVRSWPGTPMTYNNDGWYSYTINDLRQARVIFSNNGSNQDPAAGQDGYLATGNRWYCDGNWYDHQPESTIVHYFNDQNWNNVKMYYYQDGMNFPAWPGVSMLNEDYGWYTYEIFGLTSPKVIFSNNGSSQIPGSGQEGFSVSGEKWYKNGQWYDSDPTVYKDITVHYYNSNNWNTVSLYYYDTQTGNIPWPGVTMSDEGNGWYEYTIHCVTDPRVMFSNNGNNQIPGRNEPGFLIDSEKWYKNGRWYDSEPSTQQRRIKVHFYNYNNWNNVKLYYYDTGTSNYSWPGVSMTAECDGWYSYEIECIDDPKVIFSNNGSNQIPQQNGYEVSGESWFRNGTWYSARPTDITIYFKKPANWNAPNIYYYISTSDTGPSWPGTAMESVNDGWYKYTITKYSDAKVIFNDGTNQVPAANDPGFDVSGAMWYDNGTWYRYNPDTIQTNTMTGDLNGDGVIDENDYSLLEDYLNDAQNNELTQEQLALADTNGDGVVDENDMDLIEQMINGEIEEFPSDNPLVDREISYEYDKLGRVTKAIYSEDYYIEYSYDANGNITSVDVHNSTRR